MRQIESFFLGIIAAFGALIIELILFISFSTFLNQTMEISFFDFFSLPKFIVLAACVEEVFKYIMIAKKVDTFSLAKSYVTNSMLVGLGFFAAELFVMASAGIMPAGKILAEIAILHVGTAGIMGFIVGTRNVHKSATFFFAIFWATILHSTYNFLSLRQTFIFSDALLGLIGFIILANIFNFLRISRKLSRQ